MDNLQIRSNKIILHGFNADIVNKIRDHHHVLWIASDPLADIQYIEIRDSFSINYQVDLIELDRVLKALAAKADVIYECYSRHHYPNSVDGSGLSIQDYSNLLLCHVVRFLNIFDTLKPSLVISSNIPHEGYDNVLFEVARLKKVKTFKFFQVPFGPRHWIFSESLSFDPEQLKHERLDREAIDLAYMDNYINQLEGKSKLSYMLDTSPNYIPKYNTAYFSSILRDYVLQVRKPVQLLRLLHRIPRRLINDYKNYYLNQKYKKNIGSSLVKSDTLLTKGEGYGYFALHLQPELTTSALGNGIYHNQLAALKIFSDFCSANNLICIVKENPKQNFSHRSKNFFKVVSSLDNIRLVSNDEDSLALVRSASVVGTITGTVGLEAILHGVPVVCFGDAWYSSLDGVFKPSQMSRSLFHVQINIENVKHGLAKLYACAVKGVSDSDYLTEWGINPDVNNIDLLDSLSRCID